LDSALFVFLIFFGDKSSTPGVFGKSRGQPMLFADSLLDSRPTGRRRWTTLVSYGAQAIMVVLLVVAPMLYITALPNQKLTLPLIGPPVASASEPAPQTARSAAAHSEVFRGELLTPTRIPRDIARLTDSAAPPPLPGSGREGIPGATGEGEGEVPFALFTQTVPPPPRPAPPHLALRISQVNPADVISRPQPIYPNAARLAHIEGTVVLSAVISRDGGIQHLQVLSGNPLLVQAAVDAVRSMAFPALHP
jgi:periplasmic protein TonB